jgi:hypothetical protein
MVGGQPQAEPTEGHRTARHRLYHSATGARGGKAARGWLASTRPFPATWLRRCRRQRSGVEVDSVALVTDDGEL